jgi:hypothetical protein
MRGINPVLLGTSGEALSPGLEAAGIIRGGGSLASNQGQPSVDWPDAFMSYPNQATTIDWNGVNNATIEYLSFEDMVRPNPRPIRLQNCDNITIRRIDTRGCTMGLVYALNCTNLTIEYIRAENIAWEFRNDILLWVEADKGTPGYFKNENDCNLYQLDTCQGVYSHHIKGRYGNTEDVFSHYANTDVLMENVHWEGGWGPVGSASAQPSSDGRGSCVWTSESGTGAIMGDNAGTDITVKDSTFLNAGQVPLQIAGGSNCSYDNCVSYGQGYTDQPWNTGATTWNGSPPMTGHSYLNCRVWYQKGDGTPNHNWWDPSADTPTLVNNVFGDATLDIEDYRVTL